MPRWPCGKVSASRAADRGSMPAWLPPDTFSRRSRARMYACRPRVRWKNTKGHVLQNLLFFLSLLGLFPLCFLISRKLADCSLIGQSFPPGASCLWLQFESLFFVELKYISLEGKRYVTCIQCMAYWWGHQRVSNVCLLVGCLTSQQHANVSQF